MTQFMLMLCRKAVSCSCSFCVGEDWGWSNGAAPDTVSSMMGFGVGFAPFGMIFMILWWVLIIAGIVAVVQWISRSSDTARGTSALDILKERYAKGDIDKKEFDERKKDLS